MAKRKAHPKRKRGNDKVRVVMREFKEGKLYSSSGEKVTNRDQAIAIALSEQRRQTRRRKQR